MVRAGGRSPSKAQPSARTPARTSKRGPKDDALRRLVLERTYRLLELDAILRSRGEPGVLHRNEAELPDLEAQVLGPAPASAPPGPDALTDGERRVWVRQHLRVLRGGLS